MKVQKSLVALALTGLFHVANADDVRLDDVIVQGSQCVGLDCVNGESFGFDTIRMKENNLRIKFQDTSSSSSFPTADWQLIANESSNGGNNYFGIECIDNGTTPLYVSASAPNHALFIGDGSRGPSIGVNKNTPRFEIDIADDDTPSVRLEQDGSTGWRPWTWDIGGNESNFFVRDATTGTLPLRIEPGAPANSVYVSSDGDIGLGTSAPKASVDVISDQPTILLRTSTSSPEDGAYSMSKDMLTGHLTFNGFTDAEPMPLVTISPAGDLNAMAALNVTGDISGMGNLTVAGEITSEVDENQVPDYVFEPSYKLMPLDEVEAHIKARGHLPKVPSAKELSQKGVNHRAFQMKLLEKIEELTLHTIAQEKRLRKLEAQNKALKAQLK